MKINQHKDYIAGQDSLERTRKLLKNDHRILSLTREQLRHFQQTRLREMLAYAKLHSPWYQKRFQKIDPSHFKLEDLERIPIMNKHDLMNHWDEIVTDKALNHNEAGAFLQQETEYQLFHGYHLFASGGSSGRRGMYVWSPEEVAMAVAGLYRYQYRDDFASKTVKDPLRVASIAALKPVHFSETVFAFPAVPWMESIAFSALSPIDDLVQALNEYQPTHLNGYPSLITRLALQAVNGNLNISPKRILVGSEPLLKHMLDIISKAWIGVKINNQWGSTDTGAHASTCDYSDGHLHLHEDAVIIEGMDEQNKRVPVGNSSAKIIITNLYRKSMPIFRYEMDDKMTLIEEPCICGVPFQLIHSIEGRHEDDFVYGGVVVMAELFENSLMPEPGVDEYQVFQTQNGADILIVPCPGMKIAVQKMKQDLVSSLESLGLIQPHIDIKFVEHLQRHPETCKLKRFNSLENQKNKSRPNSSNWLPN